MKSCLLVDDSRVIRKVTRQILESLNFICAEAENGSAALAACTTQMPDLILLDWNMPIMDGMEFLQALRAMPQAQSTMVIFCSTENGIEHIRKALAAGANEYIMKPFDADIIRDKLAQIGMLHQQEEKRA